jgi:class 3 adenylate cyclase
LELPGDDHDFFLGDTQPMLAAIEEFLTGRRPPRTHNRVLATVLFADIANSTEMASTLGDHRWRTVLDHFETIAIREIGRFRGKLIDTAGDGLLATFDGPARAIECGTAIRDGLRTLDLETRVGIHTGEVEQRESKVAGLAVHIAARIQGLASPGQVLVSRTVRDLVAGSDMNFESVGAHELHGVDGRWELHEVRL